MNIHCITGMPRAGSTLLCNILNQNDLFHASTTSVLPGMLQSVSTHWNTSLEIKGMLENAKSDTEERMKDTQLAMVRAWYKFYIETFSEDMPIFDKSRAWSVNSLVFRHLFPKGLMIVCVRDLRNIFGSIEKQNRVNPLVDEAQDWLSKGEFQRADQMFGNNGIIGLPINGIHDVIRRNDKNVLFVKFEKFAENPESIMREIYKKLDLDYFDHQFENVENTSEDPDGLYLHKYPHKGEGKVEPCDPNEWKEFVSEETANLIMGKFTAYNEYFGYNQKNQMRALA